MWPTLWAFGELETLGPVTLEAGLGSSKTEVKCWGTSPESAGEKKQLASS